MISKAYRELSISHQKAGKSDKALRPADGRLSRRAEVDGGHMIQAFFKEYFN